MHASKWEQAVCALPGLSICRNVTLLPQFIHRNGIDFIRKLVLLSLYSYDVLGMEVNTMDANICTADPLGRLR